MNNLHVILSEAKDPHVDSSAGACPERRSFVPSGLRMTRVIK